MSMAVKKSQAEKVSSTKAPGSSRKIEEIDFFDYLRNKKDRRYIEEIGVADYLRKKRQPEAP